MRKTYFLANVIFLVATLSSCGFKPLYSSAPGALTEKLTAVELQPPDSIEEILLYDRIRKFFSSGENKKYRLKLRTSFSSGYSVISKNSDITREKQKIIVEFTLISLEDDKELLQASFNKSGSYNILSSAYANTIKKRQMREDLAKSAGEELLSRLSFFLKRLDK